MQVSRFSHCFTRSQLELILDDYLCLRPYYLILINILRNYTQKFEQQPHSFNKDHPHPVRIFSKDAFASRNILDESNSQIRCTLAGASRYYYVYPLQCLIELLESQQFYKQLPQNIIVNNLLTNTNLQIIKEALTIVSEDMSKKIKTTLAGRQVNVKPARVHLTTVIQKEEEIIEHKEIMQSRVDIHGIVQEEDEIEILDFARFDQPRKMNGGTKTERTDARLTRSEQPSRKFTYLQDFKENECSYCQNYLYYLCQTTGHNLTDDTLNRLSRESIRCLRLIAATVSHFTLYLMETNQTHIPNDINIINKVLNSIGIVITEDIYASELNPKNISPPTLPNSKPKNLIEELEPYFCTIDNSAKALKNKAYSIQDLFRMIIYCPSTDQVIEQLRNYQAELFERESSVLRGGENQEKIKLLLRQQCEDMRDYQEQRLQILKNSVNMKPIYRQLQFQLSPPAAVPATPHPYNGYHPSNTTSRAKFTSNDLAVPNKASEKNNSSPSATGQTPMTKPLLKQNKSVMMELSRSLSKIYNNDHDEADSKRRKKRKGKEQQKKSEGFFLSSISSVLKKSTLKFNGLSNSLKGSSQSENPKNDETYQLSDQQFKKMLMNAYSRNHGLNRVQMAAVVPNTPSSFNPNNTGGNFGKNVKRNNGYSSSLSQLIGKRQEQLQIECIEKKEKQVYNKQLLNGVFVRNEVYEELQNGKACLFENYTEANSIKDSMRLHLKHVDFVLTEAEENPPPLVKVQSKEKKVNIIEENSTKFNQTGLIRNEKYNKCIKSELINHRHSYLMANQQQKKGKGRYAQRAKTNNLKDNYVSEIFKEELGKIAQAPFSTS